MSYKENMKPTISKYVVLIFLISLFLIPNISFGLDRKTCMDMISGAKTDFGAKIMFSTCLQEKNKFINQSKRFKCAKKAFKEDIEFAAKIALSVCME